MGVPSYMVAGLLLVSCVRSDNSTACEPESWAEGPWAAALEDWATTAHSDRHGRVMSLPPAPGYYVSDRVDRPPHHHHHPPQLAPPPLPPQGPAPYDEWQPPPGEKVINRPGAGAPYKDKPFKPSPAYPPPPNQIPPSNQVPPSPQIPPSNHGPPHHHYNPHRGPGPMPPSTSSVDRIDNPPPRKEVSETDLYLLSAIEKLVYRVDLMEKRLRRMEENVHYLVVGAEPKPEPCVANFSRVAGICYHFSETAVDWKSANLQCRKLRASLLELDSRDERRTVAAAMLADKRIRGMDVWTGGLNPGLLWIWSHSARPVVSNSTSGAGAGAGGGNDTVTIVGEGRCLALVHDPAGNNYVYRGQDCAFRHRYICEKEDDRTKLSNDIERVARALSHSARKARVMITGDDDPQ